MVFRHLLIILSIVCVLFLSSFAHAATPTATAQSIPIVEDTITVVQLGGTDADGDVLTCYRTSDTNCSVTIDAATCEATITPDTDYTGTSMYFYFYVSDGNRNSGNAKVSMTVTPVNDPPVAIDRSETMEEDYDPAEHGSYADSFTLYATDVDNSYIDNFYIVSGPAHGSLSELNEEDGTDAEGNSTSVYYTPNRDFNGTDSFTYKANDGTDDSNTATITVTVTPVNDHPTASDVSVETPNDTPVTITLLGSDVDGDTLTYFIASHPANGSLGEVFGDQVLYTPNGTFVGGDSFTYTVSDGIETWDPATVTINVQAAAGTAAPVVSDMAVETDEDTPFDITLIVSDEDSSEEAQEVLVSEPSHGTITTGEKPLTIHYAPEENFYGTDSFTYSVFDGANLSNSATVTITVNPVNDSPIVVDVDAETDENTPVTFSLSGSDIDSSYFIFDTVDEADSYGQIDIDGSSLTYTPDTYFDGVATITYEARDGEDPSNTGTITITVTGDNQAPLAKNLKTTLLEDANTVITLEVPDPEGDAVDYTVVSDPSHGTVEPLEKGVRYTPDENYYGIDSFTYQLSDGLRSSNTARVTLNITAVVDPTVDCDSISDDTHLQIDPLTGLEYFDDVVQVSTKHALSESELSQLLGPNLDGTIPCKIEQSRLTPDEIAGLGSGFSGSTAGYGYYVLAFEDTSNFKQIQNIANELKTLSFVEEASAYVIIEPELAAQVGATDNERLNSGLTDEKFLRPIYLQGAWEYLRAAQESLTLNHINMALIDTGVCANSTYYDACYSLLANLSVPTEFEGFTHGDPYNFGNRTLVETPDDPADQPPGLPIGEVDKDGHGTKVAMLMAGASNENSPVLTDSRSSMHIGNGVLGGVWGLIDQNKLDLYSYLTDGENYRFTDQLYEDVLPISFAHSCGKDVINMSFAYSGNDPSRTGEEALREAQLAYWDVMTARYCPSYYVQGAGNASTNFDLSPNQLTSQYSQYLYGPNIMVGATDYGSSTDKSPISNSGAAVEIYAPGYATSLAAPLVSATAGMIKATASGFNSSDLDNLIMAGADRTNPDLPFLNSASSVLLALHIAQPSFVPFNAKKLTLYPFKKQSLAELRGNEGFDAGYHTEGGSWTINGSTLTIQQDGTESYNGNLTADKLGTLAPGDFQEYQEAGTYDAGDSYCFNPSASEYYSAYSRNFEFQGLTDMTAQLFSTENYEAGLTSIEVSDSTDLPTATIIPSGTQTKRLVGKQKVDYDLNAHYEFHFLGHDSDCDAENSDYVFTSPFATAYCLEATYDLTPSAETDGFKLPLAPGSVESSVAYAIRNAKLEGNIRLQTPPFAYEFGTYGEDDPDWAGWPFGWAWIDSSIDMNTVSIPDCGGGIDITPQDADNLDYTPGAWCTTEYLDATDPDYGNYDEEPELTAHVEVTFDDVDCSLSLTTQNKKGRKEYWEDVAYLWDLNGEGGSNVETFVLDFSNQNAPTCSVNAHIKITWVYQANLDIEAGGNTCDNSQTGPGTYTDRRVWEGDETVVWDLTAGGFPVKDLFDIINQHFYLEGSEEPTVTSENAPILFGFSTYKRHINPTFGFDLANWQWSHGIGPVRYDYCHFSSSEYCTSNSLYYSAVEKATTNDRSVP